jgi:hypothetical protein
LAKLVFVSKNITLQFFFSVEFSLRLLPVEISANHILVSECFLEYFRFQTHGVYVILQNRERPYFTAVFVQLGEKKVSCPDLPCFETITG